MSINVKVGALRGEVSSLSLVSDGNDGTKDGKCRVSGVFGRYINDFILIPATERHGINCTIKLYDSYGDYHKGTGVMGALKTRAIDFSIVPVKFGRIPEVTYTDPMYEESMAFGSVYYYNDSVGGSVDMLDAYISFHWSYYISILISFIFFIFSWNFCLKLGRYVNKNIDSENQRARKSASWLMTCAILDQDQFPNISLAIFSVISISASVIFFIVIDCFMLNMISVDMVIISEPYSIRSYNDLMNSDARALFLEGGPEESLFKETPKDSVEYKIYKRSKIYKSADQSSTAEGMIQILSQKMVFLCRDWAIKLFANSIFPSIEDNSKYRMFVSKDETGKKFLNAGAYQKDAHPSLKSFAHKIIRRTMESGLMEWIMKVKVAAGIDPFGKRPEGSTWSNQFMAEKLDVPEMPEPEIRIENTKKFFALLIGLIFMSSFVLFYEYYRHQKEKKSLNVRIVETYKFE